MQVKPIIAIVGRPNVGKSTLFNRIAGKQKAIVIDEPGTTRDRNYMDCIFQDKAFTLIDTGGFEPASEERILVQMREQSNLAIEEADAIILGSPIYMGAATGEMRSFMERLIFQYLVYDENYSTLFTRKISTGLIYTMGVPESQIKLMGYEQNLKILEMGMKRTFGASESLLVTDTYQFDDYSKYVAPVFNPEEKAKRRKEEFPNDCQRAFDMGVRFAQQTNIC